MNVLVLEQSELQCYSWGGSSLSGFLGQNFGEFKMEVKNNLKSAVLKGPDVYRCLKITVVTAYFQNYSICKAIFFN